LSEKDDFIARAREVHGDRYDYSEAIYSSPRGYVKQIMCNNHPFTDGFMIRANIHLNGGHCPHCESPQVGKPGYTRDNFLDRARWVFGTSYDYSKTQIVDMYIETVVTCPDHGDFRISPIAHVTHHGPQGCPDCKDAGFTVETPALLYYLRVDHKRKNAPLYKIGVTKHTDVLSRWKRRREDLDRITVLKTWRFENGRDALQNEQAVLYHYSHLVYEGKATYLPNGMSECFTEDVLDLDPNAPPKPSMF